MATLHRCESDSFVDISLDTSYAPFVTDNKTTTYRAALTEAKVAFEKAMRRLHEISWEQTALEMEVAKLKRTITALAALCSESPWADELGITDSCIEVMNVERTEVTTAEVVKALEQIGFDLASQKNAHASVHTVLTRLAKKGTISKVEGEPARWRGPKFDPNADPNDIPF